MSRKKKAKSFLPPPKRCTLDLSTEPGSSTPTNTLVQEGECRTDVTGIVKMDIGGEVACIGTMYRAPRSPKLMRKFQKGEYHEFCYLYGKGYYEVRMEDRTARFLLDADGMTVETYGEEK